MRCDWMTKSLLCFLLIAGLVQTLPAADSTRSLPPSRVRITSRLHSLGFFSYSGRVVSNNPAYDFNLTWERKNWGALVFKAQDLRDHRTSNNFALAMVYRNLALGKKLTITPYLGAVLDQSRSVADRGSDFAFILNIRWSVTRHFTIDQSILVSNLALERRSLDCVSRIRFLYSQKHIDLGTWLWHNNRIFDNSEYFSAAANMAFNRIHVSDWLDLGAGVTAFSMLRTSDPGTYPLRKGLNFTLTAMLHSK